MKTLTDSLLDSTINDVRLTLGAEGFVCTDQNATDATFQKFSHEGLWLTAHVFVAIDFATVCNETTDEKFDFPTVASLIEAFS